MNRAERRKAKKQGYNERGEKVYKLTQSQLDDIVVKAFKSKRQEIIEQVTKTTVNSFIIMCLDVLNCKFGFGLRRLKRFKFFLDDLGELATDEECEGICEIEEELAKRVDLEFLHRPISEREIWDKRHWGGYEDVAPLPIPKAEVIDDD